MNSPQLVNTSAQAHHSSSNRGRKLTTAATAETTATTAPATTAAAIRLKQINLRLHQQGDSVTLPHAQTSNIYRHSPSQLPPAPLLKRHTSGGGNLNGGGGNSYIPKSASPLESHKLPNVTPTGSSTTPSIYNGAGGSSSGCSSASSSFLGVRKPSLTLNSSDIRNNNDLFAFAKDMSPALELSDHSHSPLFTDISASCSPANSNGSPTHHHQLGRLFSLSPSSMRSYGNALPKGQLNFNLSAQL
ncbi:GH14987 [Drosophila grimshawi]|uniref:GH14987 n=1 Tax=Drosophila grimshawi TaxID=7222 RepID=B4J0Z9_DROGR|nr:GH14987 [Drosophila grimshawi]